MVSSAVTSQLKPAAGTLTTIMTVTADSVLDEFIACNQGVVDDHIRFLLNATPTGVPGCCEDDRNYIFYDVLVKAKSTFSATFNTWLRTQAVMKVYSLNGNVSFTVSTHMPKPY